MTPEQHGHIAGLVIGSGREISKGEFLRRFGAADGRQLGHDLLQDAISECDAEDVEYALVVCFSFGLGEKHLQLLMERAFADWHYQHENIASALTEIRNPKATGALEHLATHVPEYLLWDDARALAVKAIWGLGALEDPGAKAVLRKLSESAEPIIASNAVTQLRR